MSERPKKKPGRVTAPKKPPRVKKTMPLISEAQATKEGFSVIEYTGEGPAMSGSGATDFACGKCGTTILAGIEESQVAGIIFKCKCGAYNSKS